MPSAIALLDEDGTLVERNESWIQLTGVHPLIPHGVAVGANYLAALSTLEGAALVSAGALIRGIEDVLQGESQTFDEDFAIGSMTNERWFYSGVRLLRTTSPRALVLIHSDITEQRRVSLALQRADALVREQELQFRQIAGVTDHIFWLIEVQPRERVLYVSPSFEVVWERSAADLYASPRLWLAAIHPDDRSRVEHVWNAWLAQPEDPLEIEFRLIRADGAGRWIAYKGHAVRDERGHVYRLGAVAHDITEIKRSYQQVAYQALLLSSVSDAIVACDAHMRVTAWNEAAERTFGWHAHEMLGADGIVALATRSAETTLALDLQVVVQQHGHWRGEAVQRHKDGHDVPVEIVIDAIKDGAGVVTDYSLLIRDITARKDSERERDTLLAQLQQSQRLDAMGQLAGSIAHDLNNLLGVMLGNAQLAELDIDHTSRVKEALGEIGRAGQRGKDIVRQILMFSRRQTPQRRPMSLVSVVQESVRFLRPLLKSPGELVLTVDDGPALMYGDSTQIQQVVVNVITNAWHAIEGKVGRVEVTIQRTSLDADTARALGGVAPGEYVALTVRDNGIGMDLTTAKHIFEPFFTTKKAGSGTGLGLAVVHGIVRSHGGVVQVESEIGQGALFRFLFPALQGAVAEDTARPVAPVVAGDHYHRLLYIDDEPMLTAVTSRLLQRLGYHVAGFTDPALATATFVAAPDAYDAVLTDLSMPQYSGLRVAREVRNARPDIPVIVCSGYITDDLQREAATIGIRALLHKPLDVEHLRATLHRELRPITDSDETELCTRPFDSPDNT